MFHSRSSLSLQAAWLTGKSFEDCLNNLETIIDEWIETAKELGREIPKPKGRKLIYA